MLNVKDLFTSVHLQVFFQSRWKSDCVAQEWRDGDGSEDTSEPPGRTETEQTLPLWYQPPHLSTVSQHSVHTASDQAKFTKDAFLLSDERMKELGAVG